MEVCSSLIFSDTAQIFLDFLRRVFCRIINYAFYSPKGSFWEKFLFELCASQSRISSDNRWGPAAQNCLVGLWIESVQIILFLKKNLVGKFINFFWTVSSNFSEIFFGLWAVTSQTFDKKIMTGSPKLFLRFQRFLWEKNCLTGKNISHQFLTLS